MDDISVFRRFFVMSNLLTEIIGGLAGGIMPSTKIPEISNPGSDPFSSQVTKQVQQNQEDDLNQTYGFPAG